MTQLDLQQRLEQAEADRRIAACVNAFDGIPTDRIEGKDLGQILAGELRLHGAGPRTDGGFGFEFSGGVCQLLAEAYADQFRESGAVNYLELLFNHTEIGPLTITMQRVEGLTPAQKLAHAETERDALQQQVNALAAENFALKNENPHFTSMQKALMAFYSDDEVPESQMLMAFSILRNGIKTPTTDAIKRRWMAEGIQSYVNKVLVENKRIAESIGKDSVAAVFDHLKKEDEEFAAQLRQPEEKGQ